MRLHLSVLCAVTALCVGSSVAQAQTASQPFMVTSGTTLSNAAATSVVQTLYPTLAPGFQAAMATELMNQYNTNIPTFDTSFENQVNNFLLETNYGPITTAFANAGASAAKTMPVDYASDFSLFTLTAGAGASVHGISLNDLQALNNPAVTNKQSPDKGAGVNASLLLGINLGFFHLPTLGWFDPSRLSAYINFFTYTSPQIASAFTASTTSFGIHGQYRLVEGISVLPFGLLRWGGVNVSTGLTYSDLTVSGSGSFDTSNSTYTFSVNSSGISDTLQLTYSYQGTANVSVDIHTFSIPIEVSTSAQLLHVLTLYAGGGMDLNFGSASGKATSADLATLTLHSVSQNTTAKNFLTPTAALLFNSPAFSPHIGDLRAFGGAQFNIVAVGFFAQANVDTASNIAVNFGARAYW